MKPNIAIIGAGIGGLTTAIALIQKGFDVTIYEQSEGFHKAGSGINLAFNAMQVYKRLGIYEEILAQANYTNCMMARTKKLDILVVSEFEIFEKEFGVKNVAIHRAILHNILLKHTGNTPIHLHKKLKTLIQQQDTVTLTFEDGTQTTSNIVIGADGIHSNVRKAIFNNTSLRDAQQICWRGISSAKINQQFKTELNEIWGKGNRFGFVHINTDKVYWFGLINKGNAQKENALSDIFADYHPIVQNIIKHTPKENILCNEIWDLKPLKKWYYKNVCLLGDAAHATTPNLGQGACQAIESAYALSLCLSATTDTEKAFEKYQNMRFEKANTVIKTSWMLGKIAQSKYSIVCLLRNFVSKLTPKSISEKQSRKMYTLDF